MRSVKIQFDVFDQVVAPEFTRVSSRRYSIAGQPGLGALDLR